jgi:hypothetical protein
VQAFWPQTGHYYPGQIAFVYPRLGLYKIAFADGTRRDRVPPGEIRSPTTELSESSAEEEPEVVDVRTRDVEDLDFGWSYDNVPTIDDVKQAFVKAHANAKSKKDKCMSVSSAYSFSHS